MGRGGLPGLQEAKRLQRSAAAASRSRAPQNFCSERRGQSQKPEEMYQLIERLVPNGESGGGGAV